MLARRCQRGGASEEVPRRCRGGEMEIKGMEIKGMEIIGMEIIRMEVIKREIIKHYPGQY